ncbi:MAG TPA: hypothetical protein VEX39_16030 [Thermoleophilaceae bacterium]|nr:hypothetical protein [Thermoleophilaceae bacterium]
MPGRTAALVGTLALIALLGYLTLNVMFREGFDILVATSLLILAVFGFGVVGALIHPPEE